VRSVLAIGGSDSSGGAGIQADLKTLQAIGVHGSTVLTAVTAQSSTAVHAVHDVPLAVILAQLAALLEDLGADVVKTGMLSSAETVEAVADAVVGLPLVVDPVGVSTTGQALLSADALLVLRSRLLPLATVVTPNLAEVEALTGFVIESAADLQEAAKRVVDLGPAWVLITGGHLPGPPVDLLHDGVESHELPGDRIDTPHTHGTGCTLASAIAGYLALGEEVPVAAVKAKAFVAEAIRRGYSLGAGSGPVRQA
jgi:hydroxymethylpyrimidine/phosphomethylpyrimidine kinase